MIKALFAKVSRVTWIILGTAVIFTTVFTWFVSHFDKVAVERDLGYSAEARRNPYLAAEMFMQRQSVVLETRHDFNLFDENPGQYDTILISGSRIGMGAVQREKMRHWLEQGGHLVLLATEFWEYDFNASRDPFLDEFGLRFYPFDDDAYDDEDDSENLTHLKFTGYDDESAVAFYAQGYLQDSSGDASFSAGKDDADELVQYSVGEGLLTVLVDFSIWDNGRITQQDHAMLLRQLVGDSPRAWLVYNRVQPSLFSLMLQQIPLVVLSAVLLLLLLLIGALWRKGPLRKDAPPVQREIMQHIAAAGEFSYRVDRGQGLINSLRVGLEQRIGQLVPGYSRLSAEQQCKKLAQLTGVSGERLVTLWPETLAPENQTQDTFVATVQLIQEIRKHL